MAEVCANCGQSVMGDAEFCPSCAGGGDAAFGLDDCPKCGRMVEDCGEVCAECGQALTYCPNPACGAVLAAGCASCRHCGTRLLQNAVAPHAEEDKPEPSASPLQEESTIHTSSPAAVVPQSAIDGVPLDVPVPDLEAVLPAQPAALPDLPPQGGMPDFFPSASNIAGMFESQLADLALSSNLVDPLSLSFYEGPPLVMREKGVLRFRIETRSIPAGAWARLQVEVGADFGIDLPLLIDITDLRPSENRELPVFRCRPLVAGTEVLEVALTLFDKDDLPVGRWRGSQLVKVTSPAQKSEIVVHGDVIDLGVGSDFNGLLGSLKSSAADRTGQGWVPVSMQPDAVYRGRLEKSSSGLLLPRQVLPLSGLDSGRKPVRWLLAERDDEHKTRLILMLGHEASMGRHEARTGGSPGADFQLLADTGDATDTRRISSVHLRLRLAQGRAFAQDVSSNGTWLNRMPVAKGEWLPLCSGDLVAPRKVASLRTVCLADEEGICGLVLWQRRAFSGCWAFALANRCFCWPFEGPAGYAASSGSDSFTGLWVARTTQGAWMIKVDNGWNRLPDSGERAVYAGWKIRVLHQNERIGTDEWL